MLAHLALLALPLSGSPCLAADPVSDQEQEAVPTRPEPRRLLAERNFEDDNTGGGLGTALCEVGDWNGDDVPDLAAGAPSIGLDQPGRVLIISGGDGERLETFTGPESGDEYGYALAYGIDLDHDGVGDLAIGARTASGEGSKRGVVYFVSGRTHELLEQRLEGIENHAFTGASLATLDDLNGDGLPDLAVGSPGESERRGLVRVYDGRSLELIHTLRGRRAGDRFGASVASARDMDGDGFDDVLVGAPNEDRGHPESGTVRVFDGERGRLMRTIIATDRYSRLGTCVVGLGDVTGDGKAEFAASAPTRELGRMTDVGRVVVYDGKTGKPLYHLDGSRPGAFFGRGLAAGSDVDGDGWPDLVIGAPYDGAPDDGAPTENASGSRALRGEMLIVSGTDGEILQRVPGHADGALAGWSVALIGPRAYPAFVALGQPGRQSTLQNDGVRPPKSGVASMYEVGRPDPDGARQ